MNKEWFEPGPDGVSPFEREMQKEWRTTNIPKGISAAFRALLAAEVPALQVGDVDKDAEIAQLRESLERTKLALNTTREQRDKFWSQRDEALDKLDAMTAERDALRARIQAGTVVYWEDVNDETGWSLLTKTRMRGDTYTALMIDIAPIAADERRGERRKGQEMKLNWGAFGGRQFGTLATHPFSMQDKRTTNSDRRRTPGTRADRGES